MNARAERLYQAFHIAQHKLYDLTEQLEDVAVRNPTAFDQMAGIVTECQRFTSIIEELGTILEQKYEVDPLAELPGSEEADKSTWS